MKIKSYLTLTNLFSKLSDFFGNIAIEIHDNLWEEIEKKNKK